MLLNNSNDIMEAQTTRQKKNALRFLKEAFDSQKHNLEETKVRPKGQLQQLISKMKVQRLKEVFYKKLMINNVHQPPRKLQLLSQQEKNNKRAIKWKGFKFHQHLLSIIYILQIVFLVITFYISSCIAFLPNFIDSNTHNSAVVIGLNVVTALLSCLKIGITSTTQTIKKGIMLIYITDIFIDYAKSIILFIDLIYLSIIVLLFILRSTSSQISYLGVALFIWSIVRISISNQNLTYFRTTFLDSFKKQQYYKLFKVILFNFIFAHFVASMLLAMALLDGIQNWMIPMNIYHQIWYVQYMWSYYWATTIMMTVGFGDFLPRTYKEGFIVSLIEFFSCIVLAYNISQIGGIISTIRASQDEYIAKLGIFKRMAQQNSVDLQLKIRIQDYLRQEKAIKQKFEFNQQNKLLDSLPQPLKKQFVMSSNGKIFSSLPFFKSLHKNTLIQLTQNFTSKVYYPGQILSKGYQNNDFIRILKEGKVGMTYRKEGSFMNGIVVEEIQIFDRQSLTAEGQFVKMKNPILLNTEFLSPGKVVNYDMNALTYSYVFQLSHQQFNTIIKGSEIDAQFFFSIVHSSFLGKMGWEQLPCEQCSESMKQSLVLIEKDSRQKTNYQKLQHLHYHSKFQCPKLHYLPLKGVIILKYVRTLGVLQQSRPNYKRRKSKSDSCLLLRRKAFKIYERKRFINERKQFQKFVQRSIASKFTKYPIKRQKNFSQFRRDKQRKNSDGNYDRIEKKINFNDVPLEFQYNLNIQQENKENSQPINQEQTPLTQSEEDDRKTIIQSVVRYAIQEVYPRRILLVFWKLQIDLMWNYFNYFPQDNAARLDNLELQKNRTSKNKALCMVGSIMNSSRVDDSFHARKTGKSYSLFEESLNGQDTEPNYKRQNSIQINTNNFDKNIHFTQNFETKRVHSKEKIQTKRLFQEVLIKDEKKKSLKKFLQVISNRPNSQELQNQIKAGSSIQRYQYKDSVINEVNIKNGKKQKKSEINQSSNLLNSSCFD